MGKELQNALNNTEYNSEKLFAKDGKMRKELNFQSGTDAESSLKLDLNKVIEELTESVTKKATPVNANAGGSALEIEADRLHNATNTAKTAKDAADEATKDAQTKGAGAGVGHRLATAYNIPDYINEAGQSVTSRTIATSADLTATDLVEIAGAAVAMGKAHAAAEKAENLFQAKNSTGGGVMEMQLLDKDLAMMADKKLSDVIDAYGAFRATLGANQNRLQSSSNNLDNMISNTAQALGSIKDTDFADEMKNHAQSEMLMQSSVMMLKKANAATQLISTLLQG
ncbi:flagellin domain-containing protein [Yersinia similis]|uniref:Flagellin domain-containing protein n=1 Tax=Yersinia similis TaxID=367190 RepID=A0A0T9RJE7_9GAMM|nr:flagellin domain-containing protein [Yersinia similis]